MAKTPPRTLTIFRSGTHTAMDGQELHFSDADLTATAAAYDPAKHEAPLVIGHPATDAPAYGWVKSLTVHPGQSGLELGATSGPVAPEFAGAVNTGFYKKISASFYPPHAKSNPVPGVYYLRHVGFLGAQPPAVKGLPPPPAFADSDAEGLVTVELDGVQFSESTPQEDTTPKNTPKDTPMDELKTLQAENARLQTELAARERLVAQHARDKVHTGHLAFCEGLAAKGKLPPGLAPVMAAALTALALPDTPHTPNTTGASTAEPQVVQFGEGSAARPLHQALAEALEGLPEAIVYGEVAPDRTGEGQSPEHVSFAAPAGYIVDPQGVALHAKALAYQRAHPNTDYLTALAAVQGR
ncbi:hypothetical protein [Megalodesulfovibrio gigas]|uniref:Putative gp32 gene product n=1 Tax=Megalodesulfovibrio gigas (strain ATCC 19364 / DSM 1382 / NCIMB 9332 / VKM B-1759) TaxID=1121448 RepID=T2G8C1_MEGG1|nr:hypothetical protein [Megalodesulfovibrio gigas]AGW12835.1 putative gp32 gene product [Megalodesulfovibrio gigas DSM 1382 = ATCC 19364]